MSKQIISEEFKRMQKLAGLITENESSEKYYALFNIHGNPLYYVITDTKKEMLDILNNAYGELTGEKNEPYSMDDMEHDIYMDKKLPHFISDDWASVTDNKEVFDSDKRNLDTEPEEYKELFIYLIPAEDNPEHSVYALFDKNDKIIKSDFEDIASAKEWADENGYVATQL